MARGVGDKNFDNIKKEGVDIKMREKRMGVFNLFLVT